MDTNQFNFIIGKPWTKGENNLKSYALRNMQVYYGNKEYAMQVRDVIRRRSNSNDYNVYKIRDIYEKFNN